jgi:signal peptidase I
VGSLFFGYRPVNIQGTSMKPTLLNGDQLWVKCLEPAGVKDDDIVALQDPVLGRIAHRLVSVESLPNGNYLLVTKGEANRHAVDGASKAVVLACSQ